MDFRPELGGPGDCLSYILGVSGREPTENQIGSLELCWRFLKTTVNWLNPERPSQQSLSQFWCGAGCTEKEKAAEGEIGITLRFTIYFQPSLLLPANLWLPTILFTSIYWTPLRLVTKFSSFGPSDLFYLPSHAR